MSKNMNIGNSTNEVILNVTGNIQKNGKDVATTDDVSGKQDKLTAGDNISINGSTISAANAQVYYGTCDGSAPPYRTTVPNFPNSYDKLAVGSLLIIYFERSFGAGITAIIINDLGYKYVNNPPSPMGINMAFIWDGEKYYYLGTLAFGKASSNTVGLMSSTQSENLASLVANNKYKSGDVVKIRGNYSGHFTGANKQIVFSVNVPKEIGNATKATLNATATVRCNGTYLVTNANFNLTITLDEYALSCGNLVFTYTSSSSLGSTNNTAVDVWLSGGSTVTFS